MLLAAFDFWPEVVFRVALRDMLDKRTVIWQKVRRDVDCICVPNFAVLKAVLLGIEHCEEAQLRPYAEVRYDNVENLVE